MTKMILKPECVILGSANTEAQHGLGVLVGDSQILAVGCIDALRTQAPQARIVDLDNQVLMPGFVNAHQHGRGITALQLGFEDDYLEPWMAGKRRRQQLSPYYQTLYGSLQLIANGVTSAIHANTVSGEASYEEEIEATLAAYNESGLRVMFGVGAMDRATLAYPSESEHDFLSELSADLRDALGNIGEPVYCASADETIALMAGLREKYAGHPRIRFAYSPAGPQWVSDDLLAALAQDANKNSIPIHMHALESMAQIEAVRVCYPNGLMRHLLTLGVAGPLTSLAHAVWLTQDDMELAAHTGCTLVRNPGSNLRLHNGIAPLGHYVKAGVRVALGTDNTTLNDDEDFLTEARLARALTRSPNWGAPAAVGSHDLLSMMTINGARAMGLDEKVGLIEPGRHADLIALDLTHVRGPYLDPDMDLLSAVLGRGRGRDVRMTMIDGQIVYQDGQFPGHDIGALIEACRVEGERSKAARAILSQAHAEQLKQHLRQHYTVRHHRHEQVAQWPYASQINHRRSND